MDYGKHGIVIKMEVNIPEKWEIGNFKDTLYDFISNESYLLENDTHEQSISAKLAQYLQKIYPNYDVDCEYNRMGEKGEKIPKRLMCLLKNMAPEDGGKPVKPDIIIHKRGNNPNFIVIEIKKQHNLQKEDKNFDFEKLKGYTEELGYTYGIYLEFSENDISDIKFFENGKEI